MIEIRCHSCDRYLYTIEESEFDPDDPFEYCSDCQETTREGMGIFRLVKRCRRKLKVNARKLAREKAKRPYYFTLPH